MQFTARFALTAVILTLGGSAAAQERSPSESEAMDRLVAKATAAEVGTPDELRLSKGWPILTELPRKLKDAPLLAAGQKLYSAKCAGCHGNDGAGNGPKAAKCTPLPRDFRRGIFKWKSAGHGHRPSRHDLTETLRIGVPGTAMPAFAELTSAERAVLVEYVRWLAMRGEFAWRLRIFIEEDVDDPSDVDEELLDELVELVREDVMESWRAAGEAKRRVLPKRPWPMMTDASVERGRKNFNHVKFSCFRCHGNDGRDAQFGDKDAWGQPAVSPDLTRGAFRGGSGPVDLYQRIQNGISGSPHPAYSVLAKQEGESAIWDLVHFLYHLAGKQPDPEAKTARRPHPREDEQPSPRVASVAPETTSQFEPAAWGTIRGRVLFGGRPPARRELTVKRNQAVLDGDKLLEASLIVDANNRGVANVVVWLERRQQGIQLPDPTSGGAADPKGVSVLCQKLRFVPRIIAVRPGQKLSFRNADPVPHSVRLAARKGRPLNQVVPPKASIVYTPSAEERAPVPLTSAIHPWMSGYVIVTENPYVAVSGADGSFTIDQVPSGTWEVRFWQERAGEISAGATEGKGFAWKGKRLLITVSPDESTDGTVTIDANQFGSG